MDVIGDFVSNAIFLQRLCWKYDFDKGVIKLALEENTLHIPFCNNVVSNKYIYTRLN